MSCAGKVAVVTGAAGNGIGRSTALTLAREHAAVVVNFRTSGEQANAIVEHIRHAGGKAVAIQAGVFVADECSRLIHSAREHFGRVDICIISPGGGWHPETPDQLDPVAAMQDVQQEIAPCFHLLPLVLPEMYQQRWGRILAITTNPHLPSPAFAYNAAKAARTQLLTLAQDPAWHHEVTVNVLAPGPVEPIPSLAEAVEQCEHGPAWHERTTTSPQDIAESVAFLCSEAGRFITGCTLPFQFRP
jgi:3-oxoacyl-[acyl-carrier protein] reductase